MSQPTRDELIERLAKAEAEREAVTMALIVIELQELLTGLEASEDQAAAGLREAAEALADPLAALAAIEADIITAEGKCVEWGALLSDDTPPDERAQARIHFGEWDKEITRLKSKRDFAESGFQPLFDQRDQARKVLTAMQAGKRTVLRAMIDPFGSPLAQETGAYVSFRMPQLMPVLLRNDRESPEWPMAIAQMDELAMRSAYRTDHLPSNAELAARALTAQMADASTTLADAPSAAEVMAADVVKLVNESAPPSRIDDYRRRDTAVPRDYMQLPGRGAR